MGLFSTYQSTSLPLLSTLYEPPPKHLISVLVHIQETLLSKPGLSLCPPLTKGGTDQRRWPKRSCVSTPEAGQLLH